MSNMHSSMNLSREEELFLRHWIYDETHFQEGVGPAKRLQLQHHVLPADLADLIAAAIPDPVEQETAGRTLLPSASLQWPWSETTFRARLEEARAILALRRRWSENRPQTIPKES